MVATRPVDDYVQLKRLVTGRGLLEREPLRHLPLAAGLTALFLVTLAGMFMTRESWWVLVWAVPAALLFGQLGFLAHDAIHNQILRTSRANYMLGLVLFNLCLGGSRGWWADKHNIHHAQPNRLGVDPDIEGGLVALSLEQAQQARGFTRAMISHQTVTIAPLLSLSVLQIRAYSGAFLRNRGLRNPGAEAGLFVIHYVAYFGALLPILGLGRGLIFAAIQQLLLGAYLGGAFLPNHIGMPYLGPGDQMDFLHRQVITARNIRAGRITDFMFGALSCQIEHHLFPAMPRHHLRETATIVRAFCEERGIAYVETSAWEAYVQVYRHLRTVGRAAGTRSAPSRGRVSERPAA